MGKFSCFSFQLNNFVCCRIPTSTLTTGTVTEMEKRRRRLVPPGLAVLLALLVFVCAKRAFLPPESCTQK